MLNIKEKNGIDKFQNTNKIYINNYIQIMKQSKNKSIGILYICTGKYISFWESFHESFEKNFLPDTIKNYYIFTDKPESISQSERVKVYYIDPMPWPLITLLRFHYFTRFRDEIINNDYLMFANSNLICHEVISEEEFLPADNQELSCVTHPGYWNTEKPIFLPYDRNNTSTAYVPYNVGQKYMMGGLYCGHTDKFMKMSEILTSRINEDFSNRIIAQWHDESQYNKYLLEGHAVRVLSPAYGYVEGWDLPFEKKIEILNKSKLFNVNLFKQGESLALHKVSSRVTLLFRIKRKLKSIMKRCKINFLYWLDTLLRKHI